MTTEREFLKHVPPNLWFDLGVWKLSGRCWDWVAIVSDLDPDLPASPLAVRCMQTAFIRIPGKHRNQAAAYEAWQTFKANRAAA